MADSDLSTPGGANGSIIAFPTLELGTPVAADPFVFGFNSNTVSVAAFTGRVYDRTGVTFTSGSGSVAVIRKITSVVGGSVFVFTSLGDGVADGTGDDICYKFGLQDGASPTALVLCKGKLSEGIPAGDVGTTSGTTILLSKSSSTFASSAWVHIRLGATVQNGGDVVLEPLLSSNGNFTGPVFAAIPGMSAQFVDGITQIATGSAPLGEGRPGFAMHSTTQNFAVAATYFQQHSQ